MMKKVLKKKGLQVGIRAKILILILMLIVICAISSLSFATTLTPASDQYLEFKIVSVQSVAGKDKQVIAELWAHNLKFKGFDLRLSYDQTKLAPSQKATNEYIQDHDEEQFFWFEEEFGEDLEMFSISDMPDWIKYILSVFPPLTSTTQHIVREDGQTFIDATDTSILLGTFSYRLFNGTIDGTTFGLKTGIGEPLSGIHISLNGVDYYEEPGESLFRITLDYASNNAYLSGIDIEYNPVSPFDKDTLTYNHEVLDYIDKLTINPLLEDEKATYTITVRNKDPEDTGQYIDNIIEENEDR